ncbi:MAG: hypothetical protein H6619_06895 [Deltaproteobacteria bacterium]|nr:hypothetical protein [Deltaproteobacteria bacterium]
MKLATLLLSFSPLAHTHFFLITALFIGMQILLQAKLRKDLTVFLLYLLPSLLSLPWLVGKENLIKFVPGWLAWHKFDPTLWGNILNSTYMWLANAWGWFLLLGLVWYLSKKHTHLISITILFLAANFVQIAIWEWDQIKVFIALYLLSIAVWSSLESKISLKLEYVLLILTLPALAELKTVFAEYKKNTPYNKEELQVALKLMEHTEPEAIILTAPTHNSPATLSGRKLFLGYIGTLHSHGIRYHKRQKLTQSLRSAINCKKTNPELPCPDYLLWNTHEKNHWKGEDPSRYENLAPTELPFLYKIK